MNRTWFDDMPVIGELPSEEAAVLLREVGEDKVAEALETTSETPAYIFGSGTSKRWWSLSDKLWLHTAHAFGYLPPAQASSDVLPLQPVKAPSPSYTSIPC